MTLYICSNCGYGSGSWLGKCPDCNQWSTFVQDRAHDDKSSKKEDIKEFQTTPFAQIKSTYQKRATTGINEFDRVLGGGIVPGEVILLTGEPGIGKSTLLLQALGTLKTVYVSGEESAEQVKDRAARLKINLGNLTFSDNLQIESIIRGIEKIAIPIELLVIDSIQTIYTRDLPAPAGAITQLRETTAKLVTYAKKSGIPIIIIGHVTKEGEVAGPRTLEHLVDCVLLFEGEKVSHHRILRALKNRFGSTDEIGIFEMKENGLAEVNNPLAFLEQHEMQNVAGKAIVGVAEGRRPLFFEIQTLTVPTNLAIPRRVVNGVEYNKVLLLLAVARKHLGLSLDAQDVYVNVVGGISVRSPAVDLGIIAALISSIQNIPLSSKTVFLGEVGLLGDIRPVYFEDKILQEAKRLKFTQIVHSKTLKNIKDLKRYFK